MDSRERFRRDITGAADARFDAWGVLRMLFRGPKKPRAQASRLLHNLSLDAFEFLLPQFVALVVAWPEAASHTLRGELLYRCAQSLHVAIKTVWLLEASLCYARESEQSVRCREMLGQVEQAAVNAAVPSRYHDSLTHFRADELTQSGSRSASPVSSPRGSTNDLTRSCQSDSSRSESSPSESEESEISSEITCCTVETRELDSEPREIDAIDCDDALSVASLHRQVAEEKTLRCDYFDAVTALFRMLERVSHYLGGVSKARRKAKLSEQLERLQHELPRGLYVPLGAPHLASQPHIAVARILHQEAVCLSSRDKVPFLFLCECERASPDLLCSDWQIARRLRRTQSDVKSDAKSDVSSDAKSDAKRESDAKNGAKCETKGEAKDERDEDEDVFGEPWQQRSQRLLNGKALSQQLASYIFKGGDDLRQEHLAMQLISLMHVVWQHVGLPLRLTPYSVTVTGADCGVLETVLDAVSIDSLKKTLAARRPAVSLHQWFERRFLAQGGDDALEAAQRRFAESSAAYALVAHILALRDRHNGNILMCRDGRVVHIDFGFLLGSSPGGNLNFESAPFKLTRDDILIMGGEDSECFSYFQVLMFRGLQALRAHVDKFVLLCSVMQQGPSLPCFVRQDALGELRARFVADLDDGALMEHVVTMVYNSMQNWRTAQYDQYQRITNGIH
ncbi:MAG: hypothetical protein MHM6MM_000190 [Cercozoa sp. M6MM]